MKLVIFRFHLHSGGGEHKGTDAGRFRHHFVRCYSLPLKNVMENRCLASGQY